MNDDSTKASKYGEYLSQRKSQNSVNNDANFEWEENPTREAAPGKENIKDVDDFNPPVHESFNLRPKIDRPTSTEQPSHFMHHEQQPLNSRADSSGIQGHRDQPYRQSESSQSRGFSFQLSSQSFYIQNINSGYSITNQHTEETESLSQLKEAIIKHQPISFLNVKCNAEASKKERFKTTVRDLFRSADSTTSHLSDLYLLASHSHLSQVVAFRYLKSTSTEELEKMMMSVSKQGLFDVILLVPSGVINKRDIFALFQELDTFSGSYGLPKRDMIMYLGAVALAIITFLIQIIDF
jgi:hypothetical protein